MTTLKQHISDGPYTVHKGVVTNRTHDIVRKDTCAEALNFPSRVLEVLRERQRQWKELIAGYVEANDTENATDAGIRWHELLTFAELIGFSREDVTNG